MRGFRLYWLKTNLRHYRHGLSYTSFELSELVVSGPSSVDNTFSLDITATVTNTGHVSGSEVVQVYITLPDIGLTTPQLQLRGFTKVRDLKPGGSGRVTVILDKYAVSYWDERKNIWRTKEGKYEVMVGQSSDNISLRGEFEVKEEFEWSGL